MPGLEKWLFAQSRPAQEENFFEKYIGKYLGCSASLKMVNNLFLYPQ